MSESGVRPITLRELTQLGFDLDSALDVPLGYSQSDGTPQLKQLIARSYPGATEQNIEVTNGTSEANYVVALSQLAPGDGFVFQLPNYHQLWGLARSLGAEVRTFRLRSERDWQPDWDEFESAVGPTTRMVYISNPNNPTGSVLSEAAMDRIAARCEEVQATLVADEVYLGAEVDRPRTPSFWGRGSRVVITSGLSKAYGIPGIRIGWIVGPPDVIQQCWSQHDYLTIGPNKLSDLMARTAVRPDVREKLFGRTREILKSNLQVAYEWLRSYEGFLSAHPPDAGAICLVKYDSAVPSVELCERIRVNQSVLLTPGTHFGLEGHFRLWLGGKPDFLREGLRRIGFELDQIRSGAHHSGTT
jgi:aspartate/methionine/tyrosine aminotransferase